MKKEDKMLSILLAPRGRLGFLQLAACPGRQPCHSCHLIPPSTMTETKGFRL